MNHIIVPVHTAKIIIKTKKKEEIEALGRLGAGHMVQHVNKTLWKKY